MRSYHRFFSLAASLLLCMASPSPGSEALQIAFPQAVDAPAEAAPRKVLDVRRLAQAPVIDGRLDDAAWEHAAAIPNFTDADNPTLVRLAIDDGTLFIGVEAHERAGREPTSQPRSRDDKVYKDDCIELWIAPLHLEHSYQFVINPDNAVFDSLTRGGAGDRTHNPQWQHAVVRTADQWTVEMAIPYEAVGLSQWYRELGFNIGRTGPGLPAEAWAGRYGMTRQAVLRLEGQAPVPEIAEASDAKGAISTDRAAVGALAVSLPRAHARPGDRWLDIDLLMDVAPESLGALRLVARLYTLTGSMPVAEVAVQPTQQAARLSVDLRRVNLREARVAIELLRGETQVGAASLNLHAQAAAPVAAGKRIAVNLDVPAGADRVHGWPVTFGVPFAAGELWDAGRLRLIDGAGQVIPHQKEVTGRWSRDGAIQWVRFDALVDSEAGAMVEVVGDDAAGAAAGPVLSVERTDEAVVVDTGAARYTLGTGSSPIQRIEHAGKVIARSEGVRGLYVVDQNGRVASASAEGESMVVEAAGPVAACIRFEGFYRAADGEPLARHITRVALHAGRPEAQITHTLVLSRDSSEVYFRDIGWEFAVEPGSDAAALLALSPDDAAKHRAIPLSEGQPAAYMLQDSHYLFMHGENHYEVATLDAEGRRQVQAEGAEIGDWAALLGDGGGLAIACREAARQHPKEFLVARDRVVLRLWSDRAGETLNFEPETLAKRWDLANWDRYERDGQIKAMQGYKANAIGWSKTHELQIFPVAADADAGQIARTARLHSDPVYAMVDPAWIYHSRAMGPNYPADPERFGLVDQTQRAAVEWWMETDRNWGENGFVDYNAGPHITYRNGRPIGRRYAFITYQLRPTLWLALTRVGDRAMRDFVSGTTRAYMDNIHTHYTDASTDLVRGLFRQENGPLFGVPIYWGSATMPQIQSSTDLNTYLWAYHLTGYRRARDVVELYADGIKSWWTPARAKGAWRIIQLHKAMTQCYTLTWDAELKAMIDQTADLFEDPEGEIGLTKDRPYNSSTYKTMVDLRGLINAWHMLGEPRYRDLAQKVAGHWWMNALGPNPYAYGYNPPHAVVGQFLYELTGDPRYAQGLAETVRATITAYDPETGQWRPDTIQGAHSSAFMMEIGYALDLIARTGADRKPVASSMGWNNVGSPTRLFVRKPHDERVMLEYHTPVRDGTGWPSGDVRAPHVEAWGADGRWGQDLNQVHHFSEGYGSIVLPKDAPAWTYAVDFPFQGNHRVLAGSNVPMVLHAPDYWMPQPEQRPAVKYYFQVPEAARGGAIFFEGSARLFAPDGSAWNDGAPASGWVELDGQAAGLWAFEPVDSKLVKVRNLPPLFAFGSPEHFFVPEGLEWAADTDVPADLNVPLAQVYVPGVSAMPGDQAMHLGGTRHLVIEAAPADPSGATPLLNMPQGTVEFWFKPTWNSVDLPAGTQKWLMLGRTNVTESYFVWRYQVQDRNKQLLAMFRIRRPDGSDIGSRSFRSQTLFDAGQWVHVAWSWGNGKNRLFVNGRMGQHKEGLWPAGGEPIAAMTQLLIGAYRPEQSPAGFIDELRISDVARYTEDFFPLARYDRFKPDAQTRVLMHFDGNADVESLSGAEPAVVVQVLETK